MYDRLRTFAVTTWVTSSDNFAEHLAPNSRAVRQMSHLSGGIPSGMIPENVMWTPWSVSAFILGIIIYVSLA